MKKCNIYFLQDTHFEKKLEPYIRAEWGVECIFSSHNSQSRGVAILFNNNFDFESPQNQYLFGADRNITYKIPLPTNTDQYNEKITISRILPQPRVGTMSVKYLMIFPTYFSI